MEFQTLKKSHLKRNIIIGIMVIGIISACILTFTRSKYKNTQSIPLVNGTINYSLADLNIVAITVDGSEVDQIPDGNYELTSESYCTVNGEKDSNVKLSYDSTTKGLSVTPMTTKGIKCYLDFEKREMLLAEIVKNDNNIHDEIPYFANVATTDEGIYKAEDDWGDSYYFRGAVTNNYVKFAGYYWRIVRINGDGSIRIIYDGTSAHANGESSDDRQIQVSSYNSSYNDNAYVGYMYGSTGANSYAATHANNNNSTIKGVLDNWYTINIANKGFGDKISKEAGFCNDRGLVGILGYGTNETSYASVNRFLDVTWTWPNVLNPTLKCNQINNDLYTVSESSKGNKALTYPIGLITVDEMVFGGGNGRSTNTNYYLYTGQDYWTMTPRNFSNWAIVFYVEKNGIIGSNISVYSPYGVRPVINLARDVVIKSGNGTIDTPYEI
ncbi:unknown [Mycoplasma sp. CAG:776]|nr:unknown [Mycoplasma sp. CAG:776]